MAWCGLLGEERREAVLSQLSHRILLLDLSFKGGSIGITNHVAGNERLAKCLRGTLKSGPSTSQLFILMKLGAGYQRASKTPAERKK